MLESQGWLCAYCETPLGDDYHTDHMTSIARGGDDNWDNIAVVCSRCNFRKHRLTLEEYVNSYLYDVENGVAAIMATGLEALTWRQIAAALGFERTVPRRWMSECGLRAEKRFVDGHWAYHVERDDLVAFIRERAVS